MYVYVCNLYYIIKYNDIFFIIWICFYGDENSQKNESYKYLVKIIYKNKRELCF